jgi:hypothetical protein
MAVLSRKTCGIAIDALERTLTRTSIERLFWENDVPSQISGSSKAELLLNAFRAFETMHRQDLALELVRAALRRTPDDSMRKQIQSALLRDGFVDSGDQLVPEETRSAENKTALEELVAKHAASLTHTTLIHHLHEAEELFRLEKWDASIGQARNFTEQLLLDVAKAVSASRSETPELDRPIRVRNYLESSGFIDETERQKLVDGVYGYFSNEGSHPGISKQSTARICLSILWTFGFYVLEKFDEWLG